MRVRGAAVMVQVAKARAAVGEAAEGSAAEVKVGVAAVATEAGARVEAVEEATAAAVAGVQVEQVVAGSSRPEEQGAGKGLVAPTATAAVRETVALTAVAVVAGGAGTRSRY